MHRALRAALSSGLVIVSCLHQDWAAAAQAPGSYPSRPIRLIIANTTGTSVDTLSRVIVIKLGEELEQQIVAEYKRFGEAIRLAKLKVE